ncbi:MULTISPECIES: RluA family pseudouridine synthase [Candidatus Ichthyocystis]|nr:MULTISPECIES: RluA family pseudouridine synthase [Ichthyocystis]
MTKENNPSTTVTVQEECSGQRLDNYLIRITKRQLPRSRIHRMIRSGEVRVNRRRRPALTKLTIGDKVRVPPFFTKDTNKRPRHNGYTAMLAQFDKDIIYEDDSLLAINKPSGLSCHGGSGISLGLIEQIRLIMNQYKFLELVHRLDRDTSGIVLIAKKKSTLTGLHSMFRDRKIDKRYVALIDGKIQDPFRSIKLPLGVRVRNNEKIAFIDKINGKPSITEIFLLLHNTGNSLIEARPLSGRTHQIRIHLSAVGYPIVGDTKYGKNSKGNRLFLHEHMISFQHPISREQLTLTSPIPKEMICEIRNSQLRAFHRKDSRATLSAQQLVDMIQ